MTFHKHMRREMHWPITFVQITGILALVTAWAFNPVGPRPLETYDYLIVLSGLAILCAMLFTKNVPIWRAGGPLFIVTITLFLAREVSYLGTHMEMWGMIATNLIALGMSIFFVKTRDYLISLAAVWIIMWDVNTFGVDPLFQNIFYIYVALTTLIGACLNATHVRTMNSSYMLMRNYRDLSQIDFLTKAPNRRSLMEAIQETLEECANAKSQDHWFLMLDIDNFKRINDDLGHARGDDVLINLAQVFKQDPTVHYFGRLGGEEFGVIYKDRSEKAILRSIETILLSTKTYAPCPYSFSAGLTKIDAAEDLSNILSQADRELYNAKRNGKSRTYYQGKPFCVVSGREPNCAEHGSVTAELDAGT